MNTNPIASRQRRRRLAGAAALLLAVAAGCSRREASAPASATMAIEAPAPSRAAAPSGVADEAVAAGDPGAPGPAAVRRQLVRNASLDLVVADVDSAAARIETIAVAEGGWLADENGRRVDGFPSRSMTLRVPAARLDPFLARVKALAQRVEGQSITTEDVTDQAVDLEARLRTLRATEEELLGLLRETRARGGKAEDVMAVYRELTGIRTQVEQLDAQRRTLAGQVAMSAVTVSLTADAATRPIAGAPWSPGRTVRNSLRTLLGGLRGLGDAAIFAVVVLLPLGLLLAFAAWLVARVLRATLGRLFRKPGDAGPRS